jgi:4-hydroxybenzoyl-CoA thioesterase
MTFISQQLVRFAHIDGANIVFYPRYFEMVNAAVEDYFAQAIGVSFASMHRDRSLGVPTVKLEAEFFVVSRLGDLLDFALDVSRVGKSSANVDVRISCGGELRFQAKVVLVCMDMRAGRSTPWPVDMCPRLMTDGIGTVGQP